MCMEVIKQLVKKGAHMSTVYVIFLLRFNKHHFQKLIKKTIRHKK